MSPLFCIFASYWVVMPKNGETSYKSVEFYKNITKKQ